LTGASALLADTVRSSALSTPDVRQAAVQALAAGWREHPDTLPLLHERANTNQRR